MWVCHRLKSANLQQMAQKFGFWWKYLTGEESSSQSSSETVEAQQRDQSSAIRREEYGTIRGEEEDGREVVHQEMLEKARRSETGPVVHHHQGIVETRRRGESQEGNNERESGFTESEFLLIMIIINPHNSWQDPLKRQGVFLNRTGQRWIQVCFLLINSWTLDLITIIYRVIFVTGTPPPLKVPSTEKLI